MNREDNSFESLVAMLLRLSERCGRDLYRRAVTAARVAVARVVLDEAERLAGQKRSSSTDSPGKVMRFPIERRFNEDSNPHG